MRARTLLAWGVHLYTALGLAISGIVAVLLVRGGAGSIRAAFLLLVAATVIDATDGTLARAVHVGRVLPDDADAAAEMRTARRERGGQRARIGRGRCPRPRRQDSEAPPPGRAAALRPVTPCRGR